ncbi:hypothetical protein EIP86_005589 [Pleurotus ostreatoroseus]|nr:hypothetical protein EIP86_005589 [Pleurotus ostreatoroseus]
MERLETNDNVSNISLDDYLEDVLPPLRPGLNVARIVEALTTPSTDVESKGARAMSAQGRWRGFPVDPADSYQHEKNVFRHLRTAVLAILRASGSERPPVSLYLNPSCVMSAGQRHHNDEYLPDAYFSAKPSCGRRDFVAFGELRKSNSNEDVAENQAKIAHSMERCFARDPRRRQLYAFTIENTGMSFWFCDRSEVSFTQPFNFITNPRPFVHFVLALLYAHPSNYGLDPTVTPVTGSNEQYDIVVHVQDGPSRTFRTLKPLCKKETLLGKGTSVWKVVEIHNGRENGPPMVLKDYWVNPQRPSEGAICQKIVADFQMTHKTVSQAPFIAVECYGDVYQDRDRRELLDWAGSLDSDDDDSDDSAGTPIVSRAQLLDELAVTGTRSKCLVHHRIGFREVCKPLSDEQSIPTIFRVLAEAALALKQLHEAGWVHRDLSADNIFIDDNGHALLGDFEFSKKLGTGVADESPTGTPQFKSIEVEDQRYRFRWLTVPPFSAENLKEKLSKMPLKVERLQEYRRRIIGATIIDGNLRLPESGTVPPFQYNPLHDLESLWWIAVYFILKKEVVGDPSSPDPVASPAQRALAARLFRHRTHRGPCMMLTTYLPDASQCLPALPRRMCARLNILRLELLCRYIVEELEPASIDKSCADGLHDLFAEGLKEVADLGAAQGLTVRSFTYVPDEEDALGSTEGVSEAALPRMHKRRRSVTPSDTSIDYAQFKRARMERAVDPQRAGVANRSRRYLERQAKTRARR